MLPVSSNYMTAMATSVRRPRVLLEVAWDKTTFQNESAHVISFDIQRQTELLNADLAPSGVVDVGTITLRNYRWRYSAWRSGGDASIRPYINGDWGATGIPVRLWVGFQLGGGATEYCPLFRGYIYNIDEDGEAKTVRLSLRDASWSLFQQRASSPIFLNRRVDDLIREYAVLGGWPLEKIQADASPFIIPCAWLDDDALWQEMTAVASSVGGRLYTDAYGVLRYEEAWHWLDHAVVWAFDANFLQRLVPDIQLALLTSSMVVEYAPRVIGKADVVHTVTEQYIIRPQSAATVDIRLDQPVLYSANFDESDYWFDNGAGLPMNRFVTMAVTYYAQRITIQFTNTHTTQPAILRFLQIRGHPILGGPTGEVEKVLVNMPPVSRTRSLRSQFYVQTHAQASYLVSLLGDRYRRIFPVWRLSGVPGIPPLELGDRVLFRDGKTLSDYREGFVIGIHSTFTPKAGYEPVFAQTIDILDAQGMFTANNYFRVGISTLGQAVCWY